MESTATRTRYRRVCIYLRVGRVESATHRVPGSAHICGVDVCRVFGAWSRGHGALRWPSASRRASSLDFDDEPPRGAHREYVDVEEKIAGKARTDGELGSMDGRCSRGAGHMRTETVSCSRKRAYIAVFVAYMYLRMRGRDAARTGMTPRALTCSSTPARHRQERTPCIRVSDCGQSIRCRHKASIKRSSLEALLGTCWSFPLSVKETRAESDFGGSPLSAHVAVYQ
ncbi:hypothetical protein FB451DRAFT_1231349 [Mycena latifolia]|nr:hypothetical protein FB451DRAFT_1231349 [Mycena latifolia]